MHKHLTRKQKRALHYLKGSGYKAQSDQARRDWQRARPHKLPKNLSISTGQQCRFREANTDHSR